MKEIRDNILGPILQEQTHDHVMMLIGSDFAFVDENSLDFEIQDLLHQVINIYGKSYLKVNIVASVSTPSDYFNALTALSNSGGIQLRSYNADMIQYDE